MDINQLLAEFDASPGSQDFLRHLSRMDIADTAHVIKGLVFEGIMQELRDELSDYEWGASHLLTEAFMNKTSDPDMLRQFSAYTLRRAKNGDDEHNRFVKSK